MKHKHALIATTMMLGLVLPSGPIATPIPAEAAFAGDNGKIVFELTCVHEDEGECESSSNGIHELVDGEPQRLTSDPGDQSPAWSSDGQKLAFSRCDSADCDIWVSDADGGNEIAVTTDSSTNEWEPAWAPGRNVLAYRACPTNSGPNECEIWSIDLDSGEEIMLTNNARMEQDPAWAPSGTLLIFEAGTCKDNTPGAAHCLERRPPQIYKIKPEQGARAVKVTSLESGARDPNYSPGGKRIVFNDDTGRLFTISPKGTGLRKFGRANSDGINDGDYSPDGRFLIMTVYIGDEAGVATWNLSNDATEMLFEHPDLWPDSPAWQPVP